MLILDQQADDAKPGKYGLRISVLCCWSERSLAGNSERGVSVRNDQCSLCYQRQTHARHMSSPAIYFSQHRVTGTI